MTPGATHPRPLPALLIEAFAAGPFQGNGAAVVRLEAAADGAWMQALARSLRQSETAFVLPWEDGWLLRWFTPTCEVDLCGHATLAALLALGHWRAVAPGTAFRFHTRSGPLPVCLDPSGLQRGSLELPGGGLTPSPLPESLQRLLLQRLGTQAEGFWTSRLGYAVALLPAEAPLESAPCLAAQLEGDLRRGLVLMQPLPGDAASDAAAAPGPQRADYRLRFFAPGLGIDEDPVTGSAHALVAPWWMERLGRPRVVGWQCSDRPGGMVCEAASSGMIRLIGTGHLLWDGCLHSAPPPGGPPAAAAWPPPDDRSALCRLGWPLPSPAPADSPNA